MKNLLKMRIGLILAVSALFFQLKAEALIVMPGDTVWPGDANGDGIVNEKDVLYVGIAWGAMGTPRSFVSDTFKPYLSTAWKGAFRNGVNYNNANCNGDTIVGHDDIYFAIDSNYGKTRPHGKPLDTTSGKQHPDLIVKSSKHMAHVGETVTFYLYAGDSLHHIDSLHGISFEMDFDTSLINKKKSSHINFPLTFLGSGASDIIQYSKNNLNTSGSCAIAVTDIIHNSNLHNCDSTCPNLICTVDIVIVDNLSGGLKKISPKFKNLTGLTSHEFNINFNVIDSGEVSVTGINAPQLVEKNTVKEAYYQDGHYKFTANNMIRHLEVTNMLGQMVQFSNPDKLDASFVPRNLPMGLYIVSFYFEDGSRVSRPVSVTGRE